MDILILIIRIREYLALLEVAHDLLVLDGVLFFDLVLKLLEVILSLDFLGD
jgi:hypothetical protein